jgi:hypothetical protein
MPALIPVDNTLGVLFIGTVFSAVLYGITVLQVYSYCNSHCSGDKWPLKSFVAFVMVVDTLNMALVCKTTYWIAVTNFGDYTAFQVLPWSIPSAVLSAVVLEVFVRFFYAYRIYLLSRRSLHLPAVISIMSLAAFGIGIVLCVNGLENSAWESSSLKHIFIATLSCDLICDVLVTFGMVYTLLRSRTPVKRTNTVLNLLAIYAINCGILNVVFALFGIILVSFSFTSCVLLPNIDPLSLNEARHVSKNAHILVYHHHRDSSLFLLVHGRLELTKLPPRDARRIRTCDGHVL